MVAKKYQNPSGGLNARGRAYFNSKGHNLKAPVTGKPKAGSKAAGRKKFLCKNERSKRSYV